MTGEVQPVPSVPARQVILSAAALWLCYFALITVRGLVVELGEFNELLWRRALVTAIGIIVTILAWPLLRRFDGRSLVTRAVAALVIMFPAALAIAFANQLAFAPVEKRMLSRITQEQQQADQDRRSADEDRRSADEKAKQAQAEASIKIRHDVSGNVLVDVLDENLVKPKVPPAPPVPDPDPDPNPMAGPRANPVPPVPPAPPEIRGISRGPDGSTIIRRPGVLVINRPDGSSEVRAGGLIIRSDADDEIETVEPDEDAESLDIDSAEIERAAQQAARAALREQATEPAAKRTVHVRERRAEAAPAKPNGAGKAAAPAARPASQAPASAPSLAIAATAPAGSSAAAERPARDTTIKIIQKSVDDEGLWRQLTDVALGRYFLLLAWAALYLALGNAAQVQAAERREGEFRRAAKNAELRSLRYQVNPHFLFNTLNSLSALVMSGRSEKAEQMIQTMSNFYRHSLASAPTADVPLEDEIALQRHYLEIEAVRFPERLLTEFDVPDDLADACVPGMILQPLVENSVKYAVSSTSSPVTIRISAREAAGKLVLTVSDDGPGKPDGLMGGTGIGLANVRDRLAARFGEEAKIESGPLPAGGYSTTLIIPVVRNDC